jgi:hypothetical protein
MDAFISRDGLTGYLLTDTACTLLPGDVSAHGFPGKVVSLPHIRTVFAMCGYAYLGSPFQMLASQFSSFDDLADKFRAPWKKAMDAGAVAASAAGSPNIKSAVLVMGWSDSAKRIRSFVAQQTKDWQPEFFDLILVPDADVATRATS